MKRLSVFTLLLVVPLAAYADDLPSCRQRFAAGTDEVPDFRRHVVPLVGKLGCNGRSCHGSFQGRGGFQLSLFGYDFEMDHKGLSERIDLDHPEASYVLHKPTLQEPHEGGKRFEVGGWEYHLLLNWIRGGAKKVAADAPQLTSLEITPPEIRFDAEAQQQPLRVVAVWSDGTREDVTCLTRFQTNDGAIAGVDENGVVTAGAPGDTHVIVLYDNAVVPVPVMRPVSELVGDRYPDVPAPTPIDEFVVRKLRKIGVVPSELCSDAEFLRRVSLDIAGTLPSAAEVREFLADSSPDKRARRIDELLETPAYAAWWTTRLCDWTGNNAAQLINASPARARTADAWYDWIYQRVADNVPYDKLVEGIVLAKGRQQGETYREYCERMSALAREDAEQSFAEEPGLIYFWGRRNFASSEERAIGFAYSFMGTRIQCAQCHKHPFDVWTQSDFEQFERFFESIRYARNGGANREFVALLQELDVGDKRGGQLQRAISQALRDGKTVPFPDVVVGRRRNRNDADNDRKKDGRGAPAQLLGGQTVDLAGIDDPRTALMDWLRNDEKQLFAKAFVNRVWSNYFHRGIVEPTDDLSLANPPSIDGLLEYLARGFVEHGYDMRWVHREICNSATYQRSWKPNDTNRDDERNFSRAVLRRLPAEVAYDALVMATAETERAETFLTEVNGRMLTRSSTARNSRRGPDYALTVFGRSTRENNCDCDRSEEASLLQTVYLRNDDEALALIDRRDGWIAEIRAQLKDGSASEDSQANAEPEENDRVSGPAARRRLAELRARLRKAREAGNRRQAVRIRVAMQKLRSQAGGDRSDASRGAESDPQPVNRPDVSSLVEEAYLRTVSRFPTDEERTIAADYIAQAEAPIRGLQDLLWSLVNTKEFIVNH